MIPFNLPCTELQYPKGLWRTEWWIENHVLQLFMTTHSSRLPPRGVECESTLLHIAAWNGNLKYCKLILDTGANGNSKNQYKGTPIDVNVDFTTKILKI